MDSREGATESNFGFVLLSNRTPPYFEYLYHKYVLIVTPTVALLLDSPIEGAWIRNYVYLNGTLVVRLAELFHSG